MVVQAVAEAEVVGEAGVSVEVGVTAAAEAGLGVASAARAGVAEATDVELLGVAAKRSFSIMQCLR